MRKTDTDSTQFTGTAKIRFSQLAAYGAGGIIPIALFNIAGILVGLMGNISLGLSAFWLGAILIIPRLWDALSDPVIGHLSDNTRTRWGRRRPYLLLGGIAVAVFFVVIWWIPKGETIREWFPTESGFHWFQLGYILFSLLLFFTACNLFEIPHGALGMEMTNDYHERTRLFSAKSFVGNLFAMSTPWLFALASLEIFKGPGGNEADGMRYVSLMIAAILIPLSVWWFIRLREPGFVKAAAHAKTPFWHDMKQTTSNRNFIMLTLTIFTLAMGFNFVQLLGSYIPIFYVYGGDKMAGATLLGINGTIWAITGLIAVFPLNWISPRLGKRNTLVIAIILMVLAQFSKILCYNPEYPYLIIIPTMLLSAGMLFFFTLGSSMVGDICDEDELETGYRSEGAYYSVFWWFIKMGSALASFVAGALIVFTLFDESQVTRVDSLQGNIRELRSKVVTWKEILGTSPAGQNLVDQSVTKGQEAATELREYLMWLAKESVKETDASDSSLSGFNTWKKTFIPEATSLLSLTADSLTNVMNQLSDLKENGPSGPGNHLVESVVPLTLRINLKKAQYNAAELEFYLQSVSLKNRKNPEHYQTLLEHVASARQQLNEINLSQPPEELMKTLEPVERQMQSLTRQTPYTLLMMRVVEIGLPILLSLFSFFFVLRYTLTEKRSYEIKELLTKRNQEPKQPTA